MTNLEENIGHNLLGTAIAFALLEILFVALRFVARYVAGTRISMDDHLMSVALVCNLALCGISLAMVYAGGAGRHGRWLAMNDPTAPVTYTKLTIPFTVFVAFSIAFAKISILTLYLRIFTDKVYRWITYGVIAVQILTLVETVVLTLAVCTPLAYLWEPTLHPGGHCIDINTFWRWCNFPNIPTDLVMLILPIPRLWALQLSKKDKVGVVITFATGSIGLITSIVRFAFFYNTNGTSDGTYTAAKLGCMSVAECGVYLIAGCLPIYRSFFILLRNGKSGNTTLGAGSRSAWKSHDTELRSIPGKQTFGIRKPNGFEQLGNEERGMGGFDSESKKNLVGVDTRELEGDYWAGPEDRKEGRIMVKRDYSVTMSHN